MPPWRAVIVSLLAAGVISCALSGCGLSSLSCRVTGCDSSYLHGLEAGAIHHGVTMILRVPKATFPRNALIRVATQVENHSSQTVSVPSEDAICDAYSWIVDARGQPVYPREAPDCGHSSFPETSVPPGHTSLHHDYFVLTADHIFTWLPTECRDIGPWDGPVTPSIKLHLTQGQAPRVRIITRPVLHAVLQPAGPVHSPLISATTVQCRGDTVSNPTFWRKTQGPVLTLPQTGSPDCSVVAWSRIAGWEGQSPAVIDYSKPCLGYNHTYSTSACNLPPNHGP